PAEGLDRGPGARSSADLERLGGEPLAFVEAPGHRGSERAEHGREPRRARVARPAGEVRDRGDLAIGAVEIADLEQREEAPLPAVDRERERERRAIADPPRHRDALAAERGAPLRVAVEEALPREPGEERRAQRAVVLRERVERFLEEPGGELAEPPVVDPAGADLEDRAREALAVAEPAREVDREPAGGDRVVEPSRLRLRRGERDQDLVASRLVGRPQPVEDPERALEVTGGVLPRERGERPATRSRRPFDGALVARPRCRLQEVVGELGGVLLRALSPGGLEHVADLPMEPGARRRRQLVVE